MFFFSDAVCFTFGVFLDDMSRSLGVSKSSVSLVGAVNSAFFCGTGPLVAALVNRFGYRSIGITGALLASFSCFLTSFSPSLDHIYVTYGLLGGAGFGMIYVPAVVAVGFYFEKWRALATGVSVCGSGIGGLVLAPTLSAIIGRTGWRVTWRVLGAAMLVCVVCAALFKPVDRKIKIGTRDDGVAKTTTVDVPISEGRSFNFFSVYHNASYPTLAEIKSRSLATLSEHSSKLIDSKLPMVPEEHQSQQQIAGCKDARKKSCTSCCGRRPWWCWWGAVGRRKCNKWRREEAPMRPMYRDDVFYSGSLMFLPEYKRSTANSQQRSVASLEYHISVTRADLVQKDLDEHSGCCSLPVKRTLATMLNFGLLRSPAFALIALSAVFTTLGIYTPYIYVQDRAIVEGGTERAFASWLVATISAANTLGRIICGLLSSLDTFKATHITVASLLTAGVITVASCFDLDVRFQFFFAALYGLTIACTSTLRIVIMVEVLGLENLTNAVGVVLLFQGFATFTGIAVAGHLMNLTGDYRCSFYFAGGVIALSVLFLVPVGYVSRWEKRKAAGAAKRPPFPQ